MSVTIQPVRSGLGRRVHMLLGAAKMSPTLTVGVVIIAGFIILGLLRPWIATYSPTLAMPDDILHPPSQAFPFGTDGNGMDVFSRVLAGIGWAFGVSVPAVVIGVVLGVPIGLVAGYLGGWVDEGIMRCFDALRVFPAMILALAVVAAAGPSLLNVVLVIGLLDSPMFARIVRAEVLVLRNSVFVEASIAIGNPTWRLLLVHLLRNSIKGALAQVAVRMAWAVRISATLAFLGVGIQAPTPEWGAMIRQGTELFVTGQWWVGIYPGLALILLVFGLNMAGDGLQELLDQTRSQRK